MPKNTTQTQHNAVRCYPVADAGVDVGHRSVQRLCLPESVVGVNAMQRISEHAGINSTSAVLPDDSMHITKKQTKNDQKQPKVRVDK